jgi:hypothetical protein
VNRHPVPPVDEDSRAADSEDSQPLAVWLDAAMRAEHDLHGSADGVLKAAPGSIRSDLSELASLAQAIEAVRLSVAPSLAFRGSAPARLMARIAAPHTARTRQLFRSKQDRPVQAGTSG